MYLEALISYKSCRIGPVQTGATQSKAPIFFTP